MFNSDIFFPFSSISSNTPPHPKIKKRSKPNPAHTPIYIMYIYILSYEYIHITPDARLPSCEYVVVIPFLSATETKILTQPQPQPQAPFLFCCVHVYPYPYILQKIKIKKGNVKILPPAPGAPFKSKINKSYVSYRILAFL